MSSILDIAKKHSVQVDNGSGVLIQPSTEEYSYVLTAKHNVLRDSKLSKTQLKNISSIEINTYDNKKIVADRCYTHLNPDIDIAILKIPKQIDLSIYPCKEPLLLDDPISLLGYPGIERSNLRTPAEEIRTHRLNVHDLACEKLTFRKLSDGDISEVVGFSGGGLFNLSGGYGGDCLIGIETKMDNADAMNEHVCGVPIACFDDIITENDLAQLLPIHMTVLNSLHTKIFLYSTCANQNNLAGLKNSLQKKALEDINKDNLIPKTILDMFYSKLQVYGRSRDELTHEDLWKAIVEMLVLHKLIVEDSSWDLSHIESFLNQYKFIFIPDAISWRHHLTEIVCSDISHLSDGGKIILVLNGEKPSNVKLSSEYLTEALPDITSGIDDPDMIDIANDSRIITNDIPVIHFGRAHENFVDENEFKLKGKGSRFIIDTVINNYSSQLELKDLV